MSDNNQPPSIEPYTIEELPDIPETQAFPDSGGGFNTDYQTFDEPESPKRSFPIFLIVMAVAVVVLVIFSFLLLNSLGGGGGDNNNGNNGNNGNSNTPVLLQWRGAFLESDVVQPLIEEYRLSNPNVTIEYSNEWEAEEDFESEARSYQLQLNTSLEDTLDAPDIFTIHNSWVGDYENIAAPSTTYSAQSFSDTFYPAAVNDFAGSGVVYGAPLWMDTYAIVYNRDMLSAIGKTEPDANWNDFITTAEQLTSKTGNTIEQAGFAAGTVNNVDFFYELMLVIIRQNGARLNNDSRVPIFSTDPNTVSAVEFYNSFTGVNETWDDSFTNDSAAFLEEKVAMIFVPSWRLREIVRINESQNLGIDIGIATPPQVPGQEAEIINWADYWGVVVNNERSNAAAAWKFIAWLNEPEQQRKLHENIEQTNGYFGNLYTRQDMSEELVDHEYLSVYNRSLPFAESWYVVKGRLVRDLFKEEFESVTVSSSSLASLENEIKQLMNLKGNRETFETN